MRIQRTEHGKIYSRTTITPYMATYTQPLHNAALAWLYHHVWEHCSWRIYRLIEKLINQNARAFREDLYIPLTNRQDIRCYHLSHKNRVEVNRVIGESYPVR